MALALARHARPARSPPLDDPKPFISLGFAALPQYQFGGALNADLQHGEDGRKPGRRMLKAAIRR